MSYRIEKGEGLAVALGRIAVEEVDVALKELKRRDHGAAIHNVRKAIKKLRALLRSVRVAFPEELFESENRRLSEAGRKISPLRDVHVQLRTLGTLHVGKDPAVGKIQQALLRREKSYARKVPALRKIVRQMLSNPRQTVETWPLGQTTPETLVAGLKRIYKQGRKTFKMARKNPTPENLHEWRKKTKSLGYGFNLVERLLPKKLAKKMSRCEKLGGTLGEDHDLFMVQQALARDHRTRPAGDYALLVKRIRKQRTKLQKRAFRLGKSVYNEKPAPFANRLDHGLGQY